MYKHFGVIFPRVFLLQMKTCARRARAVMVVSAEVLAAISIANVVLVMLGNSAKPVSILFIYLYLFSTHVCFLIFL
jgi:hypothetical protein